jgi:hypothetical protein
MERLSDLAMAALGILAVRYNLSEKELLERLVLDRFAVSDPEQNKIRRMKELERVLATNPDPERAFLAGYNAGWLHFQMRHNKSIENL